MTSFTDTSSRELIGRGVSLLPDEPRTLAELFAFVDQRVGLQNVLIVLSADHGGPEAPGQLNSMGIPASYVTPEKWDQSPGIAALKRRFGVAPTVYRRTGGAVAVVRVAA